MAFLRGESPESARQQGDSERGFSGADRVPSATSRSIVESLHIVNRKTEEILLHAFREDCVGLSDEQSAAADWRSDMKKLDPRRVE